MNTSTTVLQKHTHTSRGEQQWSTVSLAVPSFDNGAASCETVNSIKGTVMGMAHYLRHSHFSCTTIV